MDKRLVIDAYRKGLITREQCAQILGVETDPLLALINGQRGEEIIHAEVHGATARITPDSLSKNTSVK
ncbi:MAG: hypothetical protein K6T85_03390 [Gorillibacterium sp.]|nr:hypothetical protein [Gorillibacterium sp.]